MIKWEDWNSDRLQRKRKDVNRYEPESNFPARKFKKTTTTAVSNTQAIDAASAVRNSNTTTTTDAAVSNTQAIDAASAVGTSNTTTATDAIIEQMEERRQVPIDEERRQVFIDDLQDNVISLTNRGYCVLHLGRRFEEFVDEHCKNS